MVARPVLAGLSLAGLACVGTVAAPDPVVLPAPTVAAAVVRTAPRTVAETIRIPAAARRHRSGLSLAFVGDVIFGRYRAVGPYDPIATGDTDPFREVRELLVADLVVGNLETPLVHTLPAKAPVTRAYAFGASAHQARWLSGTFQVMTVANNHAFDLRRRGVEETGEILDALGIVAIGSPRHADPVRMESVTHGDWRLGFVAATTALNVTPEGDAPSLPFGHIRDLRGPISRAVAAGRADHDLVIVAMHWGEEYADLPDHYLRDSARAWIEAGADLVVGHHPHVLQGIERVETTTRRGLVMYSLGNFLFENVQPVPRLSAVVQVQVSARDCVSELTVHPVYMKSLPEPHPAAASGYMGEQVRTRMEAVSRALGTEFGRRGDALVVNGTCEPR